MSHILTVEQAADMLQMNPQVVREYLRKGMLPGRKIGRHWRLLEEDLHAFIRGGQPESEQPKPSEEERREAIHRLLGMFAGSKRTVDDFLREKHEETEEEERRWDERHGIKNHDPSGS